MTDVPAFVDLPERDHESTEETRGSAFRRPARVRAGQPVRRDGDDAPGRRVAAFDREERADAHIDALAKTYLGVDSYPFRRAGERRVTVRIRIDKVDGIGF